LRQLAGLQDKDDWDRWNDARDNGFPASLASSGGSEYIPEAIPGAYELDDYGEWSDTEEYGLMWSPRGVDADWAPYRDGYWRWFPSYGWTWVSYEPWGWTPYHYGRWAYVRDRWRWTPLININFVNINARPRYDWRWRPHHVAFFGWGGDYGRGYRDGYYDGYWKGFRDGRYGYLGWCPLSPRDRHYGPNDRAPRLEELGNFRARGGVSGMDARRFAGGRALVSRSLLNASVPAGSEVRGGRGFAALAFVRNDDLKPLHRVTPTRSDAVARGRFARRIETPIIFRRTPGGPLPAVRQSRDGWNRGARERREGPNRDERMRDGQRTSAPIGRGADTNPSEPRRGSDGRDDQPWRPWRPWRRPDYRPAERVDAPPSRSRESRERRDAAPNERVIERVRENRGAPRNEPPSRDERRSDDAPRRPDPPSHPNFRRREAPREAPRRQEERREIRRPDAPRHDNSPPRNMERPSSPPPARHSAPQRSPERSWPRRPNTQ
ncbi:MAG TPA: DUF6600 domain-containing protein, partial [Blastocatellia bacterium]